MKTILTALLILITFTCKSQLYTGASIGYSSKAPVANFQIGYKKKDHTLYYNQLIHVTRETNVPQILGLHYSYNTGLIQPYIGVDYHMLSSDLQKKDKPDEGFHLALGLTKYFKKFKIDIGMSGNVYYGCFGFYKIIN